MSQHDQTTPIHTFLDETDGTQHPDTDRTDRPDDTGTHGSVGAAGSTGTWGTSGTDPSGRYQGTTAVPDHRSGPAPVTTLVGLLGLLTTISVLVGRATDLDIPWGVVGPVAVVGAGVLLVVLGLAGLRGQRFRG